MRSQLLEVLPDFPQSMPFTAVSRQDYEAYVGKYPGYSDFNYMSIYAWSGESAALSRINENLVLWIDGYHDNKKTLSLLGENAINASINALLQYAENDEAINSDLALVPEIVSREVTDPDLIVIEDRDNHDYLLSTEHYVELSGPEFSRLRRKVSAFERDYGGRYSTEFMNLSNGRCKEEIIRIATQWAYQGTEGTIGARDEIKAIERLLDTVEETDSQTKIHCLGLFIDGVCEGFCLFEPHSCRTEEATFHFMKANLNHRSASLLILINALRTAKQELGVTTANMEQDLGIMGLRISKMRARPSGFLKKHVIRQRKDTPE